MCCGAVPQGCAAILQGLILVPQTLELQTGAGLKHFLRFKLADLLRWKRREEEESLNMMAVMLD